MVRMVCATSPSTTISPSSIFCLGLRHINCYHDVENSMISDITVCLEPVDFEVYSSNWFDAAFLNKSCASKIRFSGQQLCGINEESRYNKK